MPFYAILRAIPNKLGGVIAMVSAIFVFLLLPLTEGLLGTKKTKFSALYKLSISCLVCVFVFLGYIGGKPAVYPFVDAGAVASFLYFAIILFFFFF